MKKTYSNFSKKILFIIFFVFIFMILCKENIFSESSLPTVKDVNGNIVEQSEQTWYKESGGRIVIKGNNYILSGPEQTSDMYFDTSVSEVTFNNFNLKVNGGTRYKIFSGNEDFACYFAADNVNVNLFGNNSITNTYAGNGGNRVGIYANSIKFTGSGKLTVKSTGNTTLSADKSMKIPAAAHIKRSLENEADLEFYGGNTGGRSAQPDTCYAYALNVGDGSNEVYVKNTGNLKAQGGKGYKYSAGLYVNSTFSNSGGYANKAVLICSGGNTTLLGGTVSNSDGGYCVGAHIWAGGIECRNSAILECVSGTKSKNDNYALYLGGFLSILNDSKAIFKTEFNDGGLKTICFRSSKKQEVTIDRNASVTLNDNVITGSVASGTIDPNAKFKTNEWMKYIPDNARIGNINMVCSHDAGLYYAHDVPDSSYHNHDRTIYEQLQDGVRSFDLRITSLFETSQPATSEFESSPEKALSICHGGVKGLITDREAEFGTPEARLTLDVIIKECRKFLAENPSETIMLRYAWNKWGETYDNTTSYYLDKLFAKCGSSYKDMLFYSHASLRKNKTPTPKLGSLRGKMFFVHNTLVDESSVGGGSSCEYEVGVNAVRNWFENCEKTNRVQEYEKQTLWTDFGGTYGGGNGIMIRGKRFHVGLVNYFVIHNLKIPAGYHYGIFGTDYETSEFCRKIIATNRLFSTPKLRGECKDGSIELEWDKVKYAKEELDEYADEYELYKKTSDDTDFPSEPIATISANQELKYIDTDIQCEKTYDYMLKAKTDEMTSLDSDTLSVTALHNFNYSAEENKIIATCKECNSKVELTLTAKNTFYNGELYDGAITDFEEVHFFEKTKMKPGDVEYYDLKSGEEVEDAPVNAGEYEARIMVDGAVAKCSFQILKRPVTIVAGSMEKECDGEPLTCDEFSVKPSEEEYYGFVAGEGFESVLMTADSIQTDLGEHANVIDQDRISEFMLIVGTNLDNYLLSFEPGKLTVVKQRDIVPMIAKGKIIKIKSNKKKTLKVKFKKIANATYYEIKYVVGKKTKIIKKKKTCFTIKNLKSKKIYKVRIRGVYKYGSLSVVGSWSTVKKKKIK